MSDEILAQEMADKHHPGYPHHEVICSYDEWVEWQRQPCPACEEMGTPQQHAYYPGAEYGDKLHRCPFHPAGDICAECDPETGWK